MDCMYGRRSSIFFLHRITFLDKFFLFFRFRRFLALSAGEKLLPKGTLDPAARILVAFSFLVSTYPRSRVRSADDFARPFQVADHESGTAAARRTSHIPPTAASISLLARDAVERVLNGVTSRKMAVEIRVAVELPFLRFCSVGCHRRARAQRPLRGDP